MIEKHCTHIEKKCKSPSLITTWVHVGVNGASPPAARGREQIFTTMPLRTQTSACNQGVCSSPHSWKQADLNPRGAQTKLLLPGKCYKNYIQFSSVALNLQFWWSPCLKRIMNIHLMCYNAPTVMYYHSYKHWRMLTTLINKPTSITCDRNTFDAL